MREVGGEQEREDAVTLLIPSRFAVYHIIRTLSSASWEEIYHYMAEQGGDQESPHDEYEKLQWDWKPRDCDCFPPLGVQVHSYGVVRRAPL
jgi:hypothetical protein